MADAAGTQTSGMNQAVGKVFILYGKVKAISEDGTTRVLSVNSPVFAFDRIVTEGDGSLSIMLDGPPPTQLDIGRMSDIVIDEDVYAGVAPEDVAEATADAEQIQQALLEGEGEIELEATAAGGTTGAGGGHPTVVFDLTGEEVTPDSGAETTGLGGDTVDPFEGDVEPPPVSQNIVSLTTLTAESVFEGDQITYTAIVSAPPQDTPLVVTLDNGAVITIPVGETSGSVTVAAPGDDPYIDAGPVSASISGATGGGYDNLVIDTNPAETFVDDTIDPTVVTLTVSPESVMEGDTVTYTATVDNAPQGDLVITLDDAAGTQITIPGGQTSGSSDPVTAPDVPDGGDSSTVGIAETTGGNYEELNITDTAVVEIGDYSPEGGETSAEVDDEGLEGGIPGSALGTDDYDDQNNDLDSNEATFSGVLDHDFGYDGAGSIGFASMDGETGTVGTEQVSYSWDGETDTLTATGPRGALFTVEVTNPATGAYTVTLLDNVLHESLDGTVGDDTENDASADLTYTVTDSDGSTAEGYLGITFDDDTPALLEGNGEPQEPGGQDLVVTASSYTGIPGPGEGGNVLVNNLGGDRGFGENSLPANDDGSTGFIDVTSIFPGGMNLFGQTYNGFYINNNGNITFEDYMGTYTPYAITGVTSNPMIAPFFADVDTRGASGNVSPGGNSTGSNLVWYDLDEANGVITITWDDVGFYSQDTSLVNGFQLRIFNQGDGDFGFEFRYENIDWTTGDASGGEDGLGGTVARAGWTAGDGVNYYELPQAGDQSGMLGLETTSNPSTAPDGNWVFNVVGGEVTAGSPTDTVTVEDEKMSGGIDEVDGGVGFVNGTIVDNANWGADGFDSVTGFNVGEATFAAGATVYWDQYGNFLGTNQGTYPVTDSIQDTQITMTPAASLLVNSDGTYTYTLLDNMLLGQDTQGEQTNVLDTVSIIGQDGDGDSLAVDVTLQVTDDIPQLYVEGGSDTVTVEDEKMSGGIDEVDGGVGFVNGTIVDNVNWGADGFDSATGFSVDGQSFAAGATVYWAQDGSFLGSDDSGAAASLLVNSDGTYTYTLIDNLLLGQDTQGEQTNVLDTVSITGQDKDGDLQSVDVTLQVTDDVPTAGSIDLGEQEEGETVEINVFSDITGTAGGADGATLTGVSIDEGDGAGTVVFDSSGNITFTPEEGYSGGVTLSYTITDGDGDIADGDISFSMPEIVFPSGLAYTVAGSKIVDGENLYAVDLETGDTDRVGEILVNGVSLGPNSTNGMDLNPSDGFLYAVVRTGGNEWLVKINPTTAETEVIDGSGVPDGNNFAKVSAAAFDVDGNYYLAFGNKIYTYDFNTMDLTLIAEGDPNESFDSIAVDLNPDDGITYMYLTVGDDLYRVEVDPDSDIESPVYIGHIEDEFGDAYTVDGLAFDDNGTLWGLGNEGVVIEIDKTDASAAQVTTISNSEVTGSGAHSLAISIVDPGTYAVLSDGVDSHTIYMPDDGTGDPVSDPWPFGDEPDEGDVTIESDGSGTINVDQVEQSEELESVYVQSDNQADITVSNFDNVEVQVRGDGPSSVSIDGAVQGLVDTGEGDDYVEITNSESAGGFTINTDGGDDTLIGGSGEDTLDGGIGDDTLTGNGGADTFKVGEGNDIITDYAAGDDVISSVSGATGYRIEDLNSDGDAELVFTGDSGDLGSATFEGIDALTLDSLLGDGSGEDDPLT